MNLVFFDLETQKLLQEVGGRQNIRLLRMACAVTYSTATGCFQSYDEREVGKLVQELWAADRVIGFNIRSFDYEVLRYYAPFEKFERLPTLDLLDYIYGLLGFRVGLDALASATFNTNKTADGLQSVEWFRQGLYDKVRDYCQADVDITRRLYEYGCENRYVYYQSRSGKFKLDVNWKVE